eukprot:403363558
MAATKNSQRQEEKQFIQEDLRENLIKPTKNNSNSSVINIEELQKTTLPLMAAVAISNILYTNLHSFYPLYIESNFPQLKSTHFGFILAIFEVANLVTSLVLGLYIGTGMASAAIQICAYSFATNEMNHDKDTYIGYVEMALGVGDMIGPAIGSFMYDQSGFAGSFFGFSGMVLIGIIVSIIKIPERLNKRSEATKSVTDEDGESELLSGESAEPSFVYQELKYKDFFMNLECLVCLLSACFSVVFTLYIDCILAVYIHNSYGVAKNLIGVFFFLPSIFYVIGAPLSSYLSTIIHRRYVVLIAFSLMIVQSFFEGPSQLFGLPRSLPLVIIGVTMLGLCLSMALVPLMCELIEILESMEKYDPDQISDVTASLFNSMFNLGNLLAPLIAGVLNDNYGYVYTTDFMMVTAFIYVIFYYFTMIFGRKLN